MHSKLQKFVDTPIHFQGTLRKQPILIADSKGNYLRTHSDLIEQFDCRIEFQCRGGARFADYFYWLQSNLHKKVAQFGNIVLYIFLGTCDLTLRKGKYIELRHDSNTLAVSYLQYQISRYLQFVSHFRSVSIVFLEIPPIPLKHGIRAEGIGILLVFIPRIYFFVKEYYW